MFLAILAAFLKVRNDRRPTQIERQRNSARPLGRPVTGRGIDVPGGAFEGVRTPITAEEVLNVLRVQPSNRPILAVGWAATFLGFGVGSMRSRARCLDQGRNEESRNLVVRQFRSHEHNPRIP
jgi:hypothetical protein